MQEEIDGLREELKKNPSKRKPAFDDLGNSQPIQIAKEAKNRRFTVRKACYRESQ